MTERITACMEVCRDFAWLSAAAPVISALSAVGTLVLAWLVYKNWQKPVIGEKVSSVAIELLTNLRAFQRHVMASRMRPGPRYMDYPEAERLLADARKIHLEMSKCAEWLDALRPEAGVSEAISGLIYPLRGLSLELQIAQSYRDSGEAVKEGQRLAVFFGDVVLPEDPLSREIEEHPANPKKLDAKIASLRDTLCRIVRLEV